MMASIFYHTIMSHYHHITSHHNSFHSIPSHLILHMFRRDQYVDIVGDRVTYANAGHDLRGIQALSEIDIPGE